jgi:hypothetical protein
VSTPTTLTISAPSTASVNHNFTINGTLSAGTTGIGSRTITLQRSTNNAPFANNTTNVSGGYQFSKNETTAGTYDYRTAYAGNATLTNATSNVVKVIVKIPTALTAAAPANATVSANFTVTGKLTVNGTTTGVGNAHRIRVKRPDQRRAHPPGQRATGYVKQNDTQEDVNAHDCR